MTITNAVAELILDKVLQEQLSVAEARIALQMADGLLAKMQPRQDPKSVLSPIRIATTLNMLFANNSACPWCKVRKNGKHDWECELWRMREAAVESAENKISTPAQ